MLRKLKEKRIIQPWFLKTLDIRQQRMLTTERQETNMSPMIALVYYVDRISRLCQGKRNLGRKQWSPQVEKKTAENPGRSRG